MTERPDLEVDEPDEEVEEKKETTSNSEGGGCFFLLVLIVAFAVFALAISNNRNPDIARIKKAAEEECNRKWINALLDMPHEGYSPIIFHWTTPGEVRQKVEKIIWR